jgi:hypothetical protein
MLYYNPIALQTAKAPAEPPLPYMRTYIVTQTSHATPRTRHTL